jgi:hypothetical protein
MTSNGDDELPVNPDELYDQFPRGADHGFGPEQGHNIYRRLNDPDLFTDKAKRDDPVVRAFLEAPFVFSFAVFKSSTRESEWALHKPNRTLAGEIEGIESQVDNFPGANAARIGTFVINHDRTLAAKKLFVMSVEDGNQCGQMIYKQPPDDDPPNA